LVVSSIYRFLPFIVAAVLLLSAWSRWRRSQQLARAENVTVSSASRTTALLAALLMCSVSVFWLMQMPPQIWVRVVAVAALFGGLEQVSLAASRGRNWLLWQNRVFAGVFAVLAILIVIFHLF
jgi:hypothetical protein